jgi:hypothetical protein
LKQRNNPGKFMAMWHHGAGGRSAWPVQAGEGDLLSAAAFSSSLRSHSSRKEQVSLNPPAAGHWSVGGTILVDGNYSVIVTNNAGTTVAHDNFKVRDDFAIAGQLFDAVNKHIDLMTTPFLHQNEDLNKLADELLWEQDDLKSAEMFDLDKHIDTIIKDLSKEMTIINDAEANYGNTPKIVAEQSAMYNMQQQIASIVHHDPHLNAIGGNGYIAPTPTGGSHT